MRTLDEWKIVDVSGWPMEHQESRGKRPKYWVRDPDGVLWLRKQPRESRPTEPAIESLMLRLARAVGISAPESFACQWLDSASQPTHRGIVVRMFTDSQCGDELSLGSVELGAVHGADYDIDNRGHHTLARVRNALETLERTSNVNLLVTFAHILAFDAWTGNSDRHQENWGVIRRGGALRGLAPMFDPAACLGTELDERHPVLAPKSDVDTYLTRCGSGFGDGSAKKLLTQTQAVDAVASWPEWKANIRGWVAGFGKVMDSVEAVLPCVPPDWLPPSKANFARRLLRARLHWLQERTDSRT